MSYSKLLSPSENKMSTTCHTQQQETATIREQQNVNMSYTTVSNCYHQRTTKCQTHVLHNSKKLSPSQNNKTVKNMLYTTASNCHHHRTTKRQHVIHSSKQLSPSENNKTSNKCHTQQQVTVIIGEQQNVNNMSYTTASNCHHQRTTRCQTNVIHNSK